MSRRAAKSTIEVVTVHKSADHLRRQYRDREVSASNSYSFYSDLFLHRLVSAAQKHLLMFPVQHLLTLLVKKLCLNQLQLMFLHHLLKTSNWDIHNHVVVTNAKQLRMQEDEEYKQCVLYFYLVGYATKYYLNGQEEADIFVTILEDQVGGFGQVFEDWVNSTNNQIIRIQPVQLNDCFKELTKKDGDSLTTDYNRLVEQLLVISPSYKLVENMERTKLHEIKDKKPTKSFKPLELKESSLRPVRQSSRKMVRLDNQPEQQDVNNHLGTIFQSLQFDDFEPTIRQHSGPNIFSNGLISQYSEIGSLRMRRPSSQLQKQFNLQRSSIYDWQS